MIFSLPKSVKWRCPICGEQMVAAFGSQEWCCEACGELLRGDDFAQAYSEAIDNVLGDAPDQYGVRMFTAAEVPELDRERIRTIFPQFAARDFWSGFSLIDLLWITASDRGMASRLPFGCIPGSAWGEISDVGDVPVILAYQAACTGSNIPLRTAFAYDGISTADVMEVLHVISKVGMGAFSGYQRGAALDDIASIIKRRSLISLISCFSEEFQLELWLHDPSFSVVGDSVVKKTPKATLASLVLDGRYQERILQAIPLSRFSLEVQRSVITSESCNISDAAFSSVKGETWMSLFADPGFNPPEETRKRIRRLKICDLLNKEQSERLVAKSLSSIRWVRQEWVREGHFVSYYLSNPKDSLFQGYDFSSWSLPSWTRILSEAKEFPPGTARCLEAFGPEALSEELVERLLSARSEIACFLPEFAFKRLSPGLYLRLCRERSAPDYIISHFDIRMLDKDTAFGLLCQYPQLREKCSWKEWPLADVGRLVEKDRRFWDEYPNKARLWFFNNTRLIYGLAASLAVFVGLSVAFGVYGTQCVAVANRCSEERRLLCEENQKLESLRAIRVSEETVVRDKRLQAEAELKKADDFRIKAESEALAAKLKAEQEKDALARAKEETVKAEKDAVAAQAKAAIEKEQSRQAEIAAEEEKRKCEAKAREQELQVQAETDRQKEIKVLVESVRSAIDKENVAMARSDIKRIRDYKLSGSQSAFCEAAEVLCGHLERALNGDANRQLVLGGEYYYGTNVVGKSTERAFRWFSKARAQKNSSADLCMALMRWRGEGVKKDVSEAVDLFEEAYDKGEKIAAFMLGRIYCRKDSGVASSRNAVKWFKKLAEQGDVPSQLQLALIYLDKEGDRFDADEGFRWAKAAYNAGSGDAGYWVGICLVRGWGVEENYQNRFEARTVFKNIKKLGTSYDNVNEWLKSIDENDDQSPYTPNSKQTNDRPYELDVGMILEQLPLRD